MIYHLQRKVETVQYQAIQLVSVKRSYLERRDKNRFRELVDIPAEITLSEEQVIAATSYFDTPEGVIRLASPKTNEEFARTIYAALRSADTQKLIRVVIRQPEGSGIAIAIRDRLKRASRGR